MEDKGSVITWDFDVLKGDVTFMLVRCRRQVTSSPHEHHVSGAVGGVGSTQYTSKDWVLGVDMTSVELPLVCRDGDSLQVRYGGDDDDGDDDSDCSDNGNNDPSPGFSRDQSVRLLHPPVEVLGLRQELDL